MLHSINNGFYLPTVITNTTGNIQIHRPPYTYDPKCKELCVDKQKYDILCCTPNTSGDLQEILHHAYLDFGDATVITNIQTNTDSQIPITTEISPNSLLLTDIAIKDFIIDPENRFSSLRLYFEITLSS